MEARFTKTKMEGLREAVLPIREVIRDAQHATGKSSTLVILDDFYHIPIDDQPVVLGYLHQIVKNLDVFLKVGGVRHRVKSFVEADPPQGLQLGQDASQLSLDVTLARFAAAQSLLEKILTGVCQPRGHEIDDLLTDGGRTRLVLGSGGVARDYLQLVGTALRASNERASSASRPHNRITAEDVNEASAALSQQKQDDLSVDVGPDAEPVRARLSDVAKFCLDVNKTNVFLVDGTALREADWGKEIQALADLRLVHEIGSMSVNTGSFRGVRFFGFTLDLSTWTGPRSEQIKQIEFWTRTGKQEVRKAALVYSPDAVNRRTQRSATLRTQKTAASAAIPISGEAAEITDEALGSGEWEQSSIYDALG